MQLYLGTEPAATARYLDVNDITVWYNARRKLVEHFSSIQTPKEFRSRFTYRKQNQGKLLDEFAGDLPVSAARAFPETLEEILQLLLVQHFISGLRNSLTRKRCILKLCATLQEAINVSRLSEVAARDARAKTTTVFTIGGNTKYSGNI